MEAASNTANQPIAWRWEHSYTSLPDQFYTHVQPEPADSPELVLLNEELITSLGLDPAGLRSEDAAAVLTGTVLPQGADPIAQAYAGHQFGNFTMLGDGRAILLGEHLTPKGERVDIQLKGSGRTPYSRGGDGKAALGPMLREYLISKAMHGLGIPTTLSLAVATTGERVFRETDLPGAVLTRVARSHLRVGTFEFAARYLGGNAVRSLADYAIARHFPGLAEANQPYRELWLAVAARQTELIARWMGVGFVHGVMNTDNVSIAGETIDYGPCAFMDAYDPATVFSSIDQLGRYAYGQQPAITRWNLARFAEALLPLFDDKPDDALVWAQEAVNQLEAKVHSAWLSVFRVKLGLPGETPDDEALIKDWLALLHRHRLDFTNSFRHLGESPDQIAKASNREANAEFAAWYERWRQRIKDPEAARRVMRRNNPALIPRNHLVEKALHDAAEEQDLAPLRRLLDVLCHPYKDQPQYADLCQPAPPTDLPYRTFCGT
ncbi:MAG: YdiU family protein [Planctomycetota bacterium]